jgi:hypothetical protein
VTDVLTILTNSHITPVPSPALSAIRAAQAKQTGK